LKFCELGFCFSVPLCVFGFPAGALFILAVQEGVFDFMQSIL
jgi:hypothetical protein